MTSLPQNSPSRDSALPGQTGGAPDASAPDPDALDPVALELGIRIRTGDLTEEQRAWLDARQRWNRPLGGLWDRIAAWANMIFVDHGIFRLFYANMHRISGGAWRSAQPWPHHIRRFAAAGGRSVISLRGGYSFGSLPLEAEACAAEDLDFRKFILRSRDLPTVAEIHAFLELVRDVEAPVLLHCKSGADRAGLASALYLALIEERPVAEARKQLSPAFGHFRQGKTGVLDAFFDAYEAETGGKIPLMEWIETGYDPERIAKNFRATGWGSFLTERLLRRE